MNGMAVSLPLWAEIAVGLLILGGSLLALIGAVGLLRLGNFFQRIHAPALGNTLATWLVVAASMLAFSLTYQRPVLHEILIGCFIFITAPVTSILIVRAALHRDRRRAMQQEDRPRGLTDKPRDS